MHKCSHRLVPVLAFLCTALLGEASAAEIKLVRPDVTITEGDQMVMLEWTDSLPTDLVTVQAPRLGSLQYPWRGKATLEASGFYQGACDWTYDVSILFNPDSTTLIWDEVTDWNTFWRTKATTRRWLRLRETDRAYDFSDGLKLLVPSAGLFDTTFTGWSGARPVFGGIYRGGGPSDVTVIFQFVCGSGGTLGSERGSAVSLDWTSSLGRNGSVAADIAGATVEVSYGFSITFPAGNYPEGQTFAVEVWIPFAQADTARALPADVFKVGGSTFEGYLLLRRSVEDGMVAQGDSVVPSFKVIANLNRCRHPEFFADQAGKQDPYGTRSFTDRGLDLLLNGFPYKYAVLTYDWDSGHRLVTSDTVWTEVFPAVPAYDSTYDDTQQKWLYANKSVAGVSVVPNPYTFRAGWDQAEAKLQFVNVPLGAVIRIYDASGGFIRTVVPNQDHRKSVTPLGIAQVGTADWNLRDSDGKDVVSGIYIFRVEAGGNTKMGRFIVIR